MIRNKILLFIFSISVIVVISCSDDNRIQKNEDMAIISKSDCYYVNYDAALSIALGRLSSEEISTRSVSSTVTTREVASHKEILANLITRSSNNGVSVRFHIINFANNQGYALVSADSRTTPIYAFSETGNLDIDSACSNTGFKFFWDNAVDYFAQEVTSYEVSSSVPLTPAPTDTTLYGDVPLLAIEEYNGTYYHVRYEEQILDSASCLISAQWGQGWPYNYYSGDCSSHGIYYGYKNAAGCGPVAAAQIMSYHRYPQSYGDDSFDWSLITSYNSYHNLIFPNTTPASLETAKLIHDVGCAANAHFGSSTSTTFIELCQMFDDFGYTGNSINYLNVPYVKSSLVASKPVLATGLANNGDGHAWIIDGYENVQSSKTLYYTDPPYSEYRTIVYAPNVYYHCNWGWAGRDNGYCLNVFNGYQNNIQLIYNLTPVN